MYLELAEKFVLGDSICNRYQSGKQTIINKPSKELHCKIQVVEASQGSPGPGFNLSPLWLESRFRNMHTMPHSCCKNTGSKLRSWPNLKDQMNPRIEGLYHILAQSQYGMWDHKPFQGSFSS